MSDTMLKFHVADALAEREDVPKALASVSPVECSEEDRPENHPLWQALLDEIVANRQADLERDAHDYAE